MLHADFCSAGPWSRQRREKKIDIIKNSVSREKRAFHGVSHIMMILCLPCMQNPQHQLRCKLGLQKKLIYICLNIPTSIIQFMPRRGCAVRLLLQTGVNPHRTRKKEGTLVNDLEMSAGRRTENRSENRIVIYWIGIG